MQQPFYQQLEQFGDAIAVIDGEQCMTYAQLAQAADRLAANWTDAKPSRQLLALLLENTLEGLIHYLAVLRGNHAALLLDPAISDAQLKQLAELYQLDGIVGAGREQSFDYAKPASELAPDLAILLSTSGSTGIAKQVALSFTNLQANAASICDFLPIQARDNTLCNLPMFYSYGLSVVNSHLLCGATLVFTPYSVMQREYWQLLESLPIHSFAGVPHSYEMLLRLGFTRKTLPELRYFTQAGGKLDAKRVTMLAEYAEGQGKAFYVMYGQTEATARMAWLLPDKVKHKPDAIGTAIPGGNLTLIDDFKQPIIQPNQVGQLIYSGPNVMLGYASCRNDLSEFDPLAELETGDLAWFDDEGDFHISGRIKRMLKIHGQRIGLDASESVLAAQASSLACTGWDNQLLVCVTGEHALTSLAVAQTLNIHPSTVRLLELESLPLTANGKTDYPALIAFAKNPSGGAND